MSTTPPTTDQTIIPPVPSRTPVIDKNGIMTQPWVLFLQNIVQRVGGIIAPTNTALGDATTVLANKTDILQGISGDLTIDNSSQISDLFLMIDPVPPSVNSGSVVTSVAGRTGDVVLTASDIGGLAASATTDTTNATNITSGALNNIPIGTVTPALVHGTDVQANGAFSSAGGETKAVKAVTTTYTALTSDYMLRVTANVNVTLPSAPNTKTVNGVVTGQFIIIKNLSGSPMTVFAGAGTSIDGAASRALVANEVARMIYVLAAPTDWCSV